MINIRLRATSIPNLDAWAEAIELGAQDAAPAVAEVLRENADTCFETSTDPWGEPWASLKDSTRRDRERRNKVGKILIRDGVLRNSIAGTPTTATPGVYEASIAAGGAAAPYAMHQQFGDEDQLGRAFLPIRPNGDVELPAALDAEVAATIKDAIDARTEVAMRSDIAAEE